MPSRNKENKSETFSRRMTLGTNYMYYIAIGLLVLFLLFIICKNVVTVIGILMIALGMVAVMIAILLYDMFIYIIGTIVDTIKNKSEE